MRPTRKVIVPATGKLTTSVGGKRLVFDNTAGVAGKNKSKTVKKKAKRKTTSGPRRATPKAVKKKSIEATRKKTDGGRSEMVTRRPVSTGPKGQKVAVGKPLVSGAARTKRGNEMPRRKSRSFTKKAKSTRVLDMQGQQAIAKTPATIHGIVDFRAGKSVATGGRNATVAEMKALFGSQGRKKKKP